MPRRRKLREVFQERLKQARTDAGLTQKNLGLAAGMHIESASPRMNRYEQGIYEPDLETLQRLAVALGVPAPYLITADDTLAEAIRLLGRQSLKKRIALLALLESEAE